MDLKESMDFAERIIVKSPLCLDKIARILNEEFPSIYSHDELVFLSNKIAREYRPLLQKYGLSVPDFYWHSQFHIQMEAGSNRVLSIAPSPSWADFLNTLLVQSN